MNNEIIVIKQLPKIEEHLQEAVEIAKKSNIQIETLTKLLHLFYEEEE